MTSVDRNELSPEQLAQESQAGCRESFELLVEQYEKRVFTYLWQFTGNSHDAEDITQETFLKAYQNIHRFNPAYAFSTWLFTIAKRTAISHFRSIKPSEELSVEHEASVIDPSAALEIEDEKKSLWTLARKLKPKQYEALWLRYAEGFSIAETARIMQTNQIHVKVLLHRGRSLLAKRLQQTGADVVL
ncbi:MAG: RNA polymerase sigma factor [Verrucomicrobia bacterium]|nr:RNA polymerase sigma factor [Verrucomicrobiota bacterium]